MNKFLKIGLGFIFLFLFLPSHAEVTGLISPGDTPQSVSGNTDWGNENPQFQGNAKTATRMIINYVLFFLGIIATLGVIIGCPTGLVLFIVGTKEANAAKENKPPEKVITSEDLFD